MVHVMNMFKLKRGGLKLKTRFNNGYPKLLQPLFSTLENVKCVHDWKPCHLNTPDFLLFYSSFMVKRPSFPLWVGPSDDTKKTRPRVTGGVTWLKCYSASTTDLPSEVLSFYYGH